MTKWREMTEEQRVDALVKAMWEGFFGEESEQLSYREYANSLLRLQDHARAVLAELRRLGAFEGNAQEPPQ